MKLTTRTDYGLRAVTYLAERYGQGPISTAEVAARRNVPEAYLDQLMVSLRKAGIVRSYRGPRGGHELARPPKDITVGEVVRSLEGAVAAVECLEKADGCELTGSCSFRHLLRELQAMAERYLSSTTVADLLEMEASSTRQMYHI